MTPTRVAAITLIALSLGSPARAQGPQRELTPRYGFAGRSEGSGTLRLFGRPRAVQVESFGTVQGEGRLQLDQAIRIQGWRPQERSWVITAVGPHRYTGTLSDAAGRVTARSDGDRLTLRYRILGPLVMRQTLDLRPDGRTIDNFGLITLLGVPVGRLQETIVKKD